MPYLCIFGFLKNYCDILNSAPSKMPYLCIFGILKNYCDILNSAPSKMPYLGIFGLEFKKTIVIFEISALKLV